MLVFRFISWLLKHTTHEHHLPGYMNRFWLFFPRTKKWPQLRLHEILKSDDARALHDHPWWYLSIILRGGYFEITGKNNLAEEKWYGPGSILFRRATHLHRLVIPPYAQQRTWTLFICGAKSRDWGFMTHDRGWIKWDEYESAEEVAYHRGHDA